MDKELDIVTIMRTNRYLRLLIHALLPRKARALLKNQQNQLLKVTTALDGEDSFDPLSLSDDEG